MKVERNMEKEFGEFVMLVRSAKNKELLEDFFLGVLTPYERKVLARRIVIVKRLLAGQTHGEIAGDLKVGVGTVTRGARELNLGRFKILRMNK